MILFVLWSVKSAGLDLESLNNSRKLWLVLFLTVLPSKAKSFNSTFYPMKEFHKRELKSITY